MSSSSSGMWHVSGAYLGVVGTLLIRRSASATRNSALFAYSRPKGLFFLPQASQGIGAAAGAGAGGAYLARNRGSYRVCHYLCGERSVVPFTTSTATTTAITWPTKTIRMSSSSSSSPDEPATTTTTRTTGCSTSKRVQETLDPCVILMKQLISKYTHLWEHKGGIYSLAQGVVYWNPPSSAYQAVTQAMSNPDNALHTYCPDEGLPELTSSLKTKLSSENALRNVQVMVTSGANQAYVNCVLTFLSERDRCVVFRPFYFNHVMAVQMSRGDDALLIGTCDDEGIPDLRWLRRSLREDPRIRVVTLVNPGNPTGVSLSFEYLKEVTELCREHNVWLVMDNTYEHFDHIRANSNNNNSKEGRDDVPFYCFDEEHVVNIFSFSKGYALAGFRVGYVTVSNESEKGRDAYRQMLKVQDTIPICASRVSQVAALGALSSGRSWVTEQVATLGEGREAILHALRPLEAIMGGTGAMYVMGKLPDGMDDQDVASKLVEQYGVAVIPGSFCGFPGWIRVCYSNLPPEECEVAARRLAAGIEELCG